MLPNLAGWIGLVVKLFLISCYSRVYVTQVSTPVRLSEQICVQLSQRGTRSFAPQWEESSGAFLTLDSKGSGLWSGFVQELSRVWLLQPPLQDMYLPGRPSS